jgi:hypothetical protein
LSAPKFNSVHPRELLRYFKELEMFLKDVNVIINQEKKIQACRYLNADLLDLWKSAKEFSHSSTYEEFKEVVTKFYPGAESEQK